MHADSNVRRWESVPGIKWLGFMELDFHDALNCCKKTRHFTMINLESVILDGHWSPQDCKFVALESPSFVSDGDSRMPNIDSDSLRSAIKILFAAISR